ELDRRELRAADGGRGVPVLRRLVGDLRQELVQGADQHGLGGRAGADRGADRRRRRRLTLEPDGPRRSCGCVGGRWSFRTKDSPLRLAFRPPVERTFESPLRPVRLASTYSAALSGPEGNLRHGMPVCNRIIRALCEYSEEKTHRLRGHDRPRATAGGGTRRR